MMFCHEEDRRLVRSCCGERLMIEAWGTDALRVRCTHEADFQDQDWALTQDVRENNHPQIWIEEKEARIQNGRMIARINAEGWVSFEDVRHGEILCEYWRDREDVQRYCVPLYIKAREMKPHPGHGDYKLTARFEANAKERIYGMGQYQDMALNKKGAILELAQRNTQASVPFYLSNLGYGFLWNNPAIGRVTFGTNRTEWEADSTCEMDYWICTGDTPAEIVEKYTAVTGRPPMMPDYGMGYWQCRLRYRTQQELLDVVHRHKELGLPLDVIVADFFHWTMQGEYRFDPQSWPDIPGMIQELKSLGVELMVSIWPTVDKRSEYFQEMRDNGYLVRDDRGLGIHMDWMGDTTFFDATHPGARNFIWEKVKQSYYRYGIRAFWLDEAEPEYKKYDFDLYRYHLGPALQVSNIYPLLYAQAFYEGMQSEGQEKIINLVRCAWAGSQRFGTLVWSGDVHSSFRSMREQLSAGLSMGIAGIAWWDCDLGGFLGGDPQDPAFRELLARWFAWGAFMPVMRMHGNRIPMCPPEMLYRDGVKQFGSGMPNEVWSFGEEIFQILKKYILLRERIRPYTAQLMEDAHQRGTPVMRPLFYDFPEDERAWSEETAYMYGPDVLVAPVMEAGVDCRTVYLPQGTSWIEAATGKTFDGGQDVVAYAPIDVIPVFIRKNTNMEIY